jgi:hypothetical protein
MQGESREHPFLSGHEGNVLKEWDFPKAIFIISSYSSYSPTATE